MLVQVSKNATQGLLKKELGDISIKIFTLFKKPKQAIQKISKTIIPTGFGTDNVGNMQQRHQSASRIE